MFIGVVLLICFTDLEGISTTKLGSHLFSTVGLVAEYIEIIRQKYKRHEGWLAPFPWCEDFQFHLNDIYTRLLVVSREKKARATAEQRIVETTEIFKPHEECRQPRKVLIEGMPGMGKTTYCNKVAYDWAISMKNEGDCSPEFEMVLLLSRSGPTFGEPLTISFCQVKFTERKERNSSSTFGKINRRFY